MVEDIIDDKKVEKVTFEIKAQMPKQVYEEFLKKIDANGYDTKAEWLREQVRKYLHE